MPVKPYNKCFFIIFTLLPTFLYCQIQGTIINSESAVPLENVTILNVNNGEGTFSDKYGRFSIPLDWSKSDTVRFSSLGFQSLQIKLSKIDHDNYTLKLKKVTETISDITVTSKKYKKELSFETLESMPEGLYNFASIIYNGKIYISGGVISKFVDRKKKILANSSSSLVMLQAASTPNFNFEKFNSQIFIYDLENHNWKIISKDLIERAYHDTQIIDDNLYIFGGITLSKNRKKEYLAQDIEIFKINSDTVLVDQINPHQSVNPGSFVYNSRLFTYGGSVKKYRISGEKVYSNKIHVFNPKTGYWKEAFGMPEGKESPGVLIKNKYYFVGGSLNKPLKSIETLNLFNGKWKRIGELNTPISSTSLVNFENQIFAYTQGKILLIDVESQTVKEFLIDCKEKNAQLHINKNSLYLIGGILEDDFSKIPSNKLIQISLNQFKITAPIKSYNFAFDQP